MYSRPPKNSFYRPFFTVNIYTLCRCNLVVNTSVTFQINKTLRSDIIHEPTDFVSMSARKLRPAEPVLPSVKARTRANRRTPMA